MIHILNSGWKFGVAQRIYVVYFYTSTWNERDLGKVKILFAYHPHPSFVWDWYRSVKYIKTSRIDWRNACRFVPVSFSKQVIRANLWKSLAVCAEREWFCCLRPEPNLGDATKEVRWLHEKVLVLVGGKREGEREGGGIDWVNERERVSTSEC